jgi:hypothetical protein
MRHQDAHSILDHLLVEARLVAEKLRKAERPSEPEQDLQCLLSAA